MSFTTIGVKLAVIMIITLSDAAPIEEEPKLSDIGKESFLPQLKANVEGNLAKFMEKRAEDAFFNLKLYRLRTSDSDKSNIMKIFSPRKQDKFSVSVKWPKSEQTTTTTSDIVDSLKMDATTPSDDVTDKNMQKNDDFQDVSLVHDPLNSGIELTNDLENLETSTNLPWTDGTTESYPYRKESEEFVTTEQTLDEESKITEAVVSMMNSKDSSEIKSEPGSSLPTTTVVTKTATERMQAYEKGESSTQESTKEKEPSVTTKKPLLKEISVPEEIHVQIAPKEWITIETVKSSIEENEEADNTDEPAQENVTPKITTPIKRSTNPKIDVEPPRRAIFYLFPNAVTTTKKQMHGKPLKESAVTHSAINTQKPTTERSLLHAAEKPSEKPTTIATTVPPTIQSTEKEQKVGSSVEGGQTDAPHSEVAVAENDRTTETVIANQNSDEPKGEMVGSSLDKSEIQTTTPKTNIHHATESVNTHVPESTTSKIVNVEHELTITEAEIPKSTDPSMPKDSVVGSAQDRVVATITEENSSTVTELPLAMQAVKSEMTTVSTIESKPVTTVDSSSQNNEAITTTTEISSSHERIQLQSNLTTVDSSQNNDAVTTTTEIRSSHKSIQLQSNLTTVDSSQNNDAITTTTEISSTTKSIQLQSNSTTVKTTIKPTAKTSDKKTEATKSHAELLMSSFPNLNVHSAPHPLLSRIMLTAPFRPMQMPIFMQRNVNRNANKNANQLLGVPSPVFRRRKHVKRSAARIDDEDKVFVSPKPFGRLPCSPGEQILGATQAVTLRPTLLQRYRDMDSVEKAEHKKVVVEKIMHGVNIAGHIDGYLTNTFKSGVAALHRALNGGNEEN